MTYSPNNPVSDASRPHTGALITAQEIRDLINSATAFNSAAAEAPERGYTVLIADVSFTTLSVSGNIVFTVTDLEDTATQVTASLDASSSSGPLGYAAVASEIQSAFNSAGITGGSVTVSSIVEESRGRLVITADRGLTLRVDSSTNNIESLILGVQGRFSALPYTVPQLDPLHATPFINEDTGESTLYVNSPARVTGPAVGSAISDSGNLRIRLDVDGTTTTQDIAITAGSLASVATAINSAFNTFFNTTLTGDGYTSYELASVINTTQLSLKLDSATGATDSTYSYADVTIGISARDGSGDLIADDLAETLFGLSPRRNSNPEHVFTNSRKVAFFRGLPVIGDPANQDDAARGTMGIGVYGPAVENKNQLSNVSADSDLEIRFVADKKVPWAYDSDSSAWTRAIPAPVAPVSYDKEVEGYKLDNTGDTFNPDYLAEPNSSTKTGSSLFSLDDSVNNGGKVGEVPRLVDVRSSQSEMSFSNNSTGSRSLFREMPIFSNTSKRDFQKATRQGIPYLGDISTFEGMNSTTGVSAEGFVVAGAVGTVLERPTITASSIPDFDLQGTADIASGQLFRLICSLQPGTRNEDREALNRDWQTQILQIPAPVSGDAPSSSIFHIEQSAIGGGITGARWANTSTISAQTDNDYQATLNFGGLNVGNPEFFPNEGQGVNFTVVIPETGGRPDVTAVLRTQGDAQDATTKAGVIFSTHATLSTSFDAGTNTGLPTTYEYYRATVSVGGQISIDKVDQAGTVTNYATFKTSQPLDSTPRTLRVVVEEDDANNEYIRVYWGGTKDFANSLVEERDHKGDLLGFNADSFATRWLQEFSRGGYEGDDRVPALAGQYQIKSGTGGPVPDYNDIIGGSDLQDAEDLSCLPGLYADPNGSDDGDHIIFDQFISVGFSKFQTEAANPGLPPVSGALVRDSINAVTVSLDGVRQGIGSGNHAYQITDCTTKDPLIINLQGDLANNTLGYTQGVGADTTQYDQDPNRTINIGFEHNEALAFKETQYWPSSYTEVTPTGHPRIRTRRQLPATANRKSSKTTWDLGDHINRFNYEYDGTTWTSAGDNVYTVFTHHSQYNLGKDSKKSFFLGRASDMAVLDDNLDQGFYNSNYGSPEAYDVIGAFNRLVENPSGYWAPFGGRNLSGSGANPDALETDKLICTRRTSNTNQHLTTADGGSDAGTKIFPTVNAQQTGAAGLVADVDGWWLSVPAVVGVGDPDNDACLPVSVNISDGANSVNTSSFSLNGGDYLHSDADIARRYCTPAWTPSKQKITYAFLTTLPSLSEHQSAYGAGSTLRYQVDFAEVDGYESTWLGRSHLCMNNVGASVGDPDSASPLPRVGGGGFNKIPADYKYSQSNFCGGGQGGFISEYLVKESTGEVLDVTRYDPRGISAYGGTYGDLPTGTEVTHRSNGFYDVFSSYQSGANGSNARTPFSDGGNGAKISWKDNWFMGRPIHHPSITEVVFHQPGEDQAIVDNSSPFVTVAVTIEWWGPVVPYAIRLKCSAEAAPA